MLGGGESKTVLKGRGRNDYAGFMNVRVIRQGENLALIIPKEMFGIRDGAELELVEVKPGIYSLISPEALAGKVEAREAGAPAPGEAVKAEAAGEAKPGPVGAQLLSAEELKLLKKLDRIPYGERLPAGVQKMLLEDEKRLLDEMIAKGFVRVYKKGKYLQTGVYDIPSRIYPLVRQKPVPMPQDAPGERVSEKEALTWDGHLGRYGYVIVENEVDAKAASAKLEQEIKSGEILGTRGFDRKYYVAQRRFYDAWSSRIWQLLRQGERGCADVAKALGMSEVACKVALELMREQGEIIEKKKGLYAIA